MATYQRPKSSLDVEYVVRLSQDLMTWNYNGDGTGVIYSNEIGVESIDEEFEEVTVELFPDREKLGTMFITVSAKLF